MTERSGALQEDPLYMSYAEIISKSCGEEEEEGEDEGGGGEDEGGASIHVSSMNSFIFLFFMLKKCYCSFRINIIVLKCYWKTWQN